MTRIKGICYVNCCVVRSYTELEFPNKCENMPMAAGYWCTPHKIKGLRWRWTHTDIRGEQSVARSECGSLMRRGDWNDREFWLMYSHILAYVQPHSGLCTATFWLTYGHMLAYGQPHTGLRTDTFWLKYSHSLAYVQPHSGLSTTTFWLMYSHILAYVQPHSGLCTATLWLMYSHILA
jgi:hypothetical protein